MTRRRRATASMLLLFLLQMLGLGSGVLRAASVPADAACVDAMARVFDSPMGDMPMPDSHRGPDPSQHDSSPPCGLPWAPVGCASAAACLPALALVEQLRAAPSAVAHRGVLASDDATPESLARAPELPPPRA